MSDSIGRISVPTPTASGLTWPLTSDFPYATSRPYPTVTHRFGELVTKAQQVFQVGIGPQKFSFRRQTLSYANRAALLDFYESVQGSFQSFTYNAPNADRTTTPYSVIFEAQPLSLNELVNACQSGFNFIECPDPASAPSYTINETCLRFPSSALATALQSQVQQIIPLVHIRVQDAQTAENPDGVPDIYLSDRRCTIDGQLYRDENHSDCEHLFMWMAEDCALAHGGVRNTPGTPIQDFRGSWSSAVAEAHRLNPKVPADLLFHDLRRSAVRVMIQEAGIPEAQAMLISGHETRSMLERYNIVSLKNVQDAGAKLDAWHKAKTKPKRPKAAKNVVPIRDSKSASGSKRTKTA
jgi:hypothetical protein